MDVWLWTLGSVLLVSLISLIGVLTLLIKPKTLNKVLIYVVSFSAGTILGDVFIELLPELVKTHGFTIQISLWILIGIGISFTIEKIVQWRHCHVHNHKEDHCRPLAYMNLVGDGVHNFIDGIIIAASYIVSIPVGIATTIAVVVHEIPQEIGDFGVLLHGGFSKSKALTFNFISAAIAFVGAIIALLAASIVEGVVAYLLAFAVGNFIYIAGADLIPELHKEIGIKKAILQLISMSAGVGLIFLLLII